MVGTFLSWRTAVGFAEVHGGGLVRRAHVTSGAMLASGVATLGLSIARL